MDTTFVKGLKVVETLSKHPDLCGVSELARHLGLTKSNTHRLLQTLVACGYARNLDQSGRYELTLKVWEIGAAVLDRLDLRTVAAEYMEKLCEATGETVHLSVLEGSEVIYIAKIDSPHPVRAYSRIGGRAPAHCVATGKALLAHAPALLIEQISRQLAPHTALTITSPARLRAELGKIRKAGYASNRGEWRDGVCGVAAPIRSAGGEVCAAIGLSGPTDRFKPRSLQQMAPMVVSVAQQISSGLGFRSKAVSDVRPVRPVRLAPRERRAAKLTA